MLTVKILAYKNKSEQNQSARVFVLFVFFYFDFVFVFFFNNTDLTSISPEKIVTGDNKSPRLEL